MEEQGAFRKKLVLHFDINKTILLEDKAKGLSKDQHVIETILEE